MKRYPLFFALSALSVALSGCGAVNSLIPEIDNLTQLNGTTLEATVGTGRATISGNISRSVTFSDRELPQLNQLRRLKLRQSLDPAVSVTIPSGVYPASFTLSNLTLLIRLSDSARSAEAEATLAGPITFTRQGTSAVYQASGPVEIGDITYSNSTFSAARDVITGAPSPNTASARLSFDTESTLLPSGSTLTFTFINGKGKVEL